MSNKIDKLPLAEVHLDTGPLTHTEQLDWMEGIIAYLAMPPYTPVNLEKQEAAKVLEYMHWELSSMHRYRN